MPKLDGYGRCAKILASMRDSFILPLLKLAKPICADDGTRADDFLTKPYRRWTVERSLPSGKQVAVTSITLLNSKQAEEKTKLLGLLR